MPESLDELYGGKLISASIVKNEKLSGKFLTISNIEVQEFGKDKPKKKLLLSFKEIDKQLPLNKTNAITISESYGSDYNLWIGKKITLFITKRAFGSQTVDAVGVGCEAPAPISEECDHTYKPQPDGSLKCVSCSKIMML